ncbi:hypothetical protein ONE63_004327 [Megalurothrips usitatus]|uniref:Calponin-homology (CH) domain-containing protein n=1 Tax=Megalurothrips usitatus TaxID=439358 RepID=A0AAV7X3A7_9NEOP|nr:hypothetical protein ONE63_004327 [Megalurothrips usitatus]
MIKWLNALLSPPAELEANVDVPAIDVGDLWQRTCRQKTVSLAPSREEASSEQYDKQHRLNTLRKAAAALIRSRDVASVLQKISVRVDQKLLAIREDRDLHVDVGLQQGVLELLLCYNPLWLRIGLEAVYGRTVPLKSNCDYVGLTTFLVHNLLSDAHIVATYSHPTVPHLKLPGYQTELKKFTLKKFLFLVFFLDVAKRRAIIGHDPCLFVRSAKYKESREIVVAFARDLLAGVGDINRYLAALDCRLAHKQTYLDEFEYAVKSLLDLRDGIRLVRVMEIILEDGQLHKGLRVPAISRLQKVHNVDIAMNALAAAGFVVCGGIVSKDIVEGHREKTLSFLWQIIYKFQAPRFTSAALVVQRWWRRVCLPREIDRRIRARKRARREAAVTVMQAAWRGLQGRRRAAALREERACLEEARRRAAVVLQKHWRRHAAQKNLRRAVGAATAICRWYRGAVETRRARADFLRRRAAAVLLQAHCRGLLTRLRFAELRRTAAALRILTWYRRLRAARRMLAVVDMARQWVEERRQRREAAALTLQRRWRAHRAMALRRAEFLELKAAALTVQRRWRALKAMRVQRDEFLARRAAASTIQRRDRARFLRLRAAAVAVQRRVRARAMLRDLRDAQVRDCREAAATVLQRRWRAVQAMKAARQDFLRRRAAAVVLQGWFRGLRDARRERADFQGLRAAAVCVQRHFRARKQMQLDRGRFLTAREAAVALQRRWRARLAMRARRAAFVALRDAVRVIQGRYRALTAMRRQRRRFLALREAVVVVQRRWRAQLAMRAQRASFVKLRDAAIVVQVRYRALVVMRRDQGKYKEIHSAVFTIQRCWRAQRAMKHERQYFLALQQSVVYVQRRWRAAKVGQWQLHAFKEMRMSAIRIQAWWRATSIAKKEHERYQLLLASVKSIQVHWRMRKLMMKERSKFLHERTAVVVIQVLILAAVRPR